VQRLTHSTAVTVAVMGARARSEGRRGGRRRLLRKCGDRDGERREKRGGAEDT
jgi:hypothetical protein